MNPSIVKAGAVDNPAHVASLAVFTTSRRAEELPILRERLHKTPEPSLILDSMTAAPYTVVMFGVGTTPSLDDWLGKPDVDEKGVEWPGGDGALPAILAVFAVSSFLAVRLLRRQRAAGLAEATA